MWWMLLIAAAVADPAPQRPSTPPVAVPTAPTAPLPTRPSPPTKPSKPAPRVGGVRPDAPKPSPVATGPASPTAHTPFDTWSLSLNGETFSGDLTGTDTFARLVLRKSGDRRTKIVLSGSWIPSRSVLDLKSSDGQRWSLLMAPDGSVLQGAVSVNGQQQVLALKRR